MRAPVLEGSRVVLRPLGEADVAARLALGNDLAAFRMYGGSTADFKQPTAATVAHWYEAHAAHPSAWAIALRGEGADEPSRLLGFIRITVQAAQDRRASLALGIFDASLRGRGLGTEAIRIALGHAFGDMGLHRVAIRVLAFNTPAIRAYEKCGFAVEGREREAACIDGIWHDDVMMGLLAREFEARRS